MTVVGVISDTHSLLRPEAKQYLGGVDLIIHAGDIGSAEVLDQLGEIAPVTAIRGNVDRGRWAQTLPDNQVVEVHGQYLYVLHDLHELDLDPVAAGFQVVISGHSHVPKLERKNGVLYFNPGSAGPRRFRLPIALGRLFVDGKDVRGELSEIRS